MATESKPAEASAAEAKPVPQPAPPAGGGRGIWWLLGVVVVGAAAVFGAIQMRLIPDGFAKGSATPAAPAKPVVLYVLPEPFQAGQRAPGAVYLAEVRGDNELSLSFEVGGVVDRIGPSHDKNWEEGTNVMVGTVLAQLKPDDFTNRVKAAQSRAELARVNYERFKNLVKNMSVPQAQLDQATAEKKAADAELAAAEQAVKDSVIKAPENGTILARMGNPAEVVAPGRPVLRFSNLRRMSVDVGVPDTVVGHVKVGQELPIVFAALPGKSFTGYVAEVGVAGQEGSRLFRVKLKVPNPDGHIKSGMTASVSFTPSARAAAGAVWVPLAALVATTGADGKEQLAVYVVGEGKARRQAVQTDEISGNRILITKGVQAGDRVVVVGAGTLHDGAAVEAAPSTESFR